MSYLGIDLRATVDSLSTQGNVRYVLDVSAVVWNKYLKKPVSYLWKNVFINLIWNSLVNILDKVNIKKTSRTASLLRLNWMNFTINEVQGLSLSMLDHR
jgi:hypothetical protein